MDHLESFNPKSQTWLVADLKSKIEIQKRLLKVHGFLEEDAVLRASELWRKLLLRSRPDFRVISRDLAQVLIREKMKESSNEWAKNPGAVKLLFEYIQQLLPILSEPDGIELLGAWLKENPESALRWGHWAHLAHEIWAWLENEKLIPGTWIKGLLAHSASCPIWNRDLRVDLGIDFSPAEVRIFQTQSQEKDLTIFQPEAKWAGALRGPMQSYKLLQESADEKPAANSKILEGVQAFRFRTQVSEVKWLTAKIRELLDSGTRPDRIVVAAEDIESYWLALRNYFRVEGFPVQKSQVLRMQSLPLISVWLSDLRICSGRLSSSDLESSLFSEAQPQALNFDRFRQIFSNVYGFEDLARDKKVEELFRTRIHLDSEPLSRDQFVAWALGLWKKEPTESLNRFFQDFFSDCPASLQLELGAWIEVLERIAAKSEIEIEAADASGIQLLSLEAAELADCEVLFVLGATESSLRRVLGTGLSTRDVEKIHQDLGFMLSSPDCSDQEWQARWILEKPGINAFLSFSESDFQGDAQAPSRLWLECARQMGKDSSQLDPLGLTRWDWIQLHAQKHHADREVLLQSVEQDLGLQALPSFAADYSFSLSASQLENYNECPFVFAANKLFGLSDLPNIDLDLDHMTKGKIAHALLEVLLTEPIRFDPSESELEGLIESCLKSEKIIMGEPKLKPLFMKKYKKLAYDFLAFEKAWREKFPLTKTVAKEASINGNWSLKQKRLVPENQPEGPAFKGFIDRIDEGKDQSLVLIDYKSSGAGLRNIKSWNQGGDFQLALYTLAIERGCHELGARPVDAAVYLSLKDMNREKGFALKSSESELFSVEGRKGYLVSEEEKLKMLSEVELSISQIVEQMGEGVFAPKPKDKNQCFQCSWRGLCRATHLS